jgi:hypothetical protein
MIPFIVPDAPIAPADQFRLLEWLFWGRTHLKVLRAPEKGWNVQGDRLFRRVWTADGNRQAIEIPLPRKELA